MENGKANNKHANVMASRIAFATKILEEHGVEYVVKDEATGHMQVWRKSDDKMFNFWAGKGTIESKNNPKRGIHNLVQICDDI